MGVKINYVKKSLDGLSNDHPDMQAAVKAVKAVKQVSAAKMANMAAGPGHISVEYDKLTNTQLTMKGAMEKAFEGIDDNDPMALSKGVANFQKIVKGDQASVSAPASAWPEPKKVIAANPLKGMFGKKPPLSEPSTAKGKTGDMVSAVFANLAKAGVQTEDGKPISSIQFVDPDTGAVEHEFKNPFGGAYPEQDPANEDEGADGAIDAPVQYNAEPMPPDPEPQPFDQEDPKAFKKMMAAFYMTLVKKPASTKKG